MFWVKPIWCAKLLKKLRNTNHYHWIYYFCHLFNVSVPWYHDDTSRNTGLSSIHTPLMLSQLFPFKNHSKTVQKKGAAQFVHSRSQVHGHTTKRTLWVVGSYPPETVQPYPFELPTIVCHTARPYLFPFHHILRDSFGIPSGWFSKKVGRLLGGWWEDDGRMLGGWWEDDRRRMGR